MKAAKRCGTISPACSAVRREGYSRCTVELEPVGGAVKLTITHVMDCAESKLIEAVSGGWPRILSNLKSLLETGSIVLSA
jgi:hypothetical protein